LAISVLKNSLSETELVEVASTSKQSAANVGVETAASANSAGRRRARALLSSFSN
jgi:hypothetical protein